LLIRIELNTQHKSLKIVCWRYLPTKCNSIRHGSGVGNNRKWWTIGSVAFYYDDLSNSSRHGAGLLSDKRQLFSKKGSVSEKNNHSNNTVQVVHYFHKVHRYTRVVYQSW